MYVGIPELDRQRKHVLGWKSGDFEKSDKSMVFNVTVYNHGGEQAYGIQSARWNNYLYVGVPHLDSDRRRVLMYNEGNPQDEVSMRWKIHNHGEYFSIKNVEFNEYVYMGVPELDGERRLVLTWSKAADTPDNDPSFRWIFEKV